jgi:hypothetical protein
MLIEHQAIESRFLGELVLVQIFVVQLRAKNRIEMTIRKGQPDRTAKTAPNVVFRVGAYGRSVNRIMNMIMALLK